MFANNAQGPRSLAEITHQQSSLIRTQDGFTFRDLNKNGKLDIYEDSRQPVEARVEDLLLQMTTEEKAGLLFINGTRVNADGTIEDNPDGSAPKFPASAVSQITNKQMNHFNLWQIPGCLLYTSPSPRDRQKSRMPSSA